LLGLPIIINQNVRYDYLYITDLYRILEYFVNHDTKNKIFNVTPTEPIDLVTIADIINRISGNKTEIKVLNEGIGVEYSGDNKKLLSEIKDFQFTSYETAIIDLYEHYKEIKDTLDIDAIKQDLFLDYAKKLREEYFVKGNKVV
jgi:GDP-L-fucose synthase